MVNKSILECKPIEFSITIPSDAKGIACVDIFEDMKGNLYAEAYLSSTTESKVGNAIFRRMDYGSCDSNCPACYFVDLARKVKDLGKINRPALEVWSNYFELIHEGEDSVTTSYPADEVTFRIHAEMTEDYIVFQEFGQFLKQP